MLAKLQKVVQERPLALAAAAFAALGLISYIAYSGRLTASRKAPARPPSDEKDSQASNPPSAAPKRRPKPKRVTLAMLDSAAATSPVLRSAAARQGELLARLDANTTATVSRISAAALSCVGSLKPRVAAFVSNARRHARVVDKRLSMKVEELELAVKTLESFVQQSLAGDGSLEFTEDSIHSVAQILVEVLPGFPSFSVTLTSSPNAVLQAAYGASRITAEVDVSRSQVRHAPLLTSNDVNDVRISLLDRFNEPVYGLASEDVVCSLVDCTEGWEVSSVSVDGNVVVVAVALTAKCTFAAELHIWLMFSDTHMLIPLVVSRLSGRGCYPPRGHLHTHIVVLLLTLIL